MGKAHIDLGGIVPPGQPRGEPPANDAAHFIQCPVCAEWIDMRDLGQVEHEEKDCALSHGVTPRGS
jgi:hypothetical protein